MMYSVSAFNHANKIVLSEHVINAKDFWDANKKVEEILTESGYSISYMSISIRDITQPNNTKEI